MRLVSVFLVLFGATAALFLGWHVLGYPYSLDEARFLHKASSQIAAGAKELDLAELMPGNWELVCESHGYDGPKYLERYNKVFEPASRRQDEAWGLIFISADGSYRSAAGSCSVRGLRFGSRGCLERTKAIFVRELENGGCKSFMGGAPVGKL